MALVKGRATLIVESNVDKSMLLLEKR